MEYAHLICYPDVLVEAVNYTQMDEQDSADNHFLREVCRGPEFTPRFDLPPGQQSLAVDTVRGALQQRIEHTDAILKFVREEEKRLDALLATETREVVKSNRTKLRKKVRSKITRLEKSRTELAEVLARADGAAEKDSMMNVDGLTQRDHDRRFIHEGRIYRRHGELPRKGVTYFYIDGSWEEPL